MSSLNSLTALLQESGAQFRIYDMGRQIQKLSPQLFSQIETGIKIYPRPYQHQAWLALLLWNPKHKEQNVVWFLKFPLDEQGFLVQAVRDDFINRLMLNINQMLAATELSEAEDALKDNPFSFTPDQEKMATFHAITAKETQSSQSKYYTDCQAYFQGKNDWQAWQHLGLQGIADVAVNIDENQNSILKHIEDYQEQPFIALCCALEHSKISSALAITLLNKLDSELALDIRELSVKVAMCSALLRALNGAPNEQCKQQAIQNLLNSKLADNAEILSTIAVKMSQQLLDQETLQLFLEKLANSEAGQQGFSRIMADLMFSDNLRRAILQAFRNPQRSEKLSIAIGNMFGGKF
jgi:hypothetical protein